jgi:hypothetical protein
LHHSLAHFEEINKIKKKTESKTLKHLCSRPIMKKELSGEMVMVSVLQCCIFSGTILHKW